MGDIANPKRVSPYINFCKAKREEVKDRLKEAGRPASGTAVTKELADWWRSLSEKEKEEYHVAPNEALPGSDPNGSTHLTENAVVTGSQPSADEPPEDKAPPFPLARIKRIMKLDSDIRQVPVDVAILVTYGTQLFLEHLAGAALSAAIHKKHKTIRLEDVKHAIKNDKRVHEFIGDALDDLLFDGSESESDDNEDGKDAGVELATSGHAMATKKSVAPLPGSRCITEFFGSKQ